MGSDHSTHVANAYSKSIYVKADAERSYVTMARFAASGAVTGRNFYVLKFCVRLLTLKLLQHNEYKICFISTCISFVQ